MLTVPALMASRSKEEDEQISENIKALFGTDAGKAVLAYFRSITIDAVTGANISDQEPGILKDSVIL